MNENMFKELIESVEEAGAIRRGTIEPIKLSQEEAKLFVEILSHPMEPNENLKAAFQSYEGCIDIMKITCEEIKPTVKNGPGPHIFDDYEGFKRPNNDGRRKMRGF